MKKLKSKLPFLMLLLGMGIVFVQSAFTAKPSNRVDTFWSYNESNASEIRNGTHYTQVPNPGEACPSGSNLPCVLTVDESIDTEAKLTTYLNDFSTFPSDSDITDFATSKKRSE